MKQIGIKKLVKFVHPGDSASCQTGKYKDTAKEECDGEMNPPEYQTSFTKNHTWKCQCGRNRKNGEPCGPARFSRSSPIHNFRLNIRSDTLH